MKFDLCLKGCLGSKRTASYDIKVHVTRGTEQEYSSKPHKHSIVERTLVFKR